MMKNIIFFISLNAAMLAVTLIATPSYTASVDPGDEVRCDACHVMEQEEFLRSAVHKTLECASCHTISDFGADAYSHNATTSECISCHAGAASGMNDDAHRKLYQAGIESGIFTGSSEACVACHTRIELEIEEHRRTEISLEISYDSGESSIGMLPSGENVSVTYVNIPE